MVEAAYKDELLELYHADCADIIPQIASVNLTVTDPPYGMNFQSNHRLSQHRRISGDDDMPVDVITKLIEMSQMATYCFCRWNNLFDMPRPKSVLAWIKNNWSMGDLKHEHGRQWEAICFYPGPSHRFISRIPDVIYCARTGDDLHPTQKPIKLIREIIQANEGETVFDPFMGSGTTGVAAIQSGRKFIGIESDAEYFETARKRIMDASGMSDGDLFAR